MKKLDATLEKLATKIRQAAIALNKMIVRFEKLKTQELAKQKKAASKKKVKKVKKPKKAKSAKKSVRRKRK